jgi:hypothetical protein
MASSISLQNIPKSANESLTPEVRRAVELELDAICTDTQFRASQRNCAFLRYVITETLAGRADEIKERTLGKELFGRPISYDTGSDAVVRVRANEVRKRLICYYENHASQAGWRVHLPLRTYVPVFLPETAAKQQPTAIAPLPAIIPQPIAPTIEPLPPIAEALPPVPIQPVETAESFIPSVPIPTPILPVSRMMIPTLIALFLCAATFRWQAFSGTPYLDFWEALLEGHAGVALVLDADPADPRAVTTSDLEMVRPLLQTASMFHASAEISSSADAANQNNLLAVHITHRAPATKADEAAYITLLPGQNAQLWVGSRNSQALDLAIHSISDADLFPIALEAAVHRKAPTRLRFVDKQQIATETLSSSSPSGDQQWQF